MNNSSSPVLSILLPVRNEGVNVRIILQLINAIVEVPHEVLVIFDTEDDDTIPVVQSLQATYATLRLVHNRRGRGVVNAIQEGIAEAHGDNVLIFAADEAGPVLVINDMLSLIEQGCHFVSATRYAHGGRRLGGSLVGGILSRLANWLFVRLAGSKFSDATTGIKMFKRRIFSQIIPQGQPVGWAVAFELAIRAQMVGLKLGEVPIVSIDRLYGGKSTFRLGPWVKEYLRWFVWGMRSLRKSPHASPPIAVKIPDAYRQTN